jgi:hypothetical protein
LKRDAISGTGVSVWLYRRVSSNSCSSVSFRSGDGPLRPRGVVAVEAAGCSVDVAIVICSPSPDESPVTTSLSGVVAGAGCRPRLPAQVHRNRTLTRLDVRPYDHRSCPHALEIAGYRRRSAPEHHILAITCTQDTTYGALVLRICSFLVRDLVASEQSIHDFPRMKAEIEAYKWMLDNPDDMVDLLADELPGWAKAQIKTAWLGTYPPNTGATDVNAVLKFGFDTETQDYL